MRILWIESTMPGEAVRLSGSKMGRLAELVQTGSNVPRAFAVTVEAFRDQMTTTGLDTLIDAEVASLDPEDSAAVEAAGDRIRGAIVTTPLLEAIEADIIESYEELSDRCSDLNVPTAVRSSATGEDGNDSSFAGIFDTFLGVAGADNVVDAVRGCWASLFSPRAVAYRAQRGISHHDMPMAVGVVELVQARASGVAFSIHPVTGKSDRIVIEANWGFGEAVVQGLVTPDNFEVGKADMRILRGTINDKTVVSAFDFAAGRVSETAMPERLRQRACLDEEQVAAVADAVLSIERHYGYPVDVEWVLDRHRQPGGPISIVQSRPITVVEAQKPSVPYDPMALATKYLFAKGT